VSAGQSKPFAAYPFDYLAAELGFAVGEAHVSGNAVLSGLTGHLSVEDERMRVEGLSGGIFGGALAAEAEILDSGGRVSAEITYDISRADIAGTMADQDGLPLLRGRVSLSGAVAGSGRSALGLMSSLNGGGTYALADASLTGIDPRTFAEALDELGTPEQLDEVIESVLKQGEMRLADLTGDFTVNEGVVRFDKVDFEVEDAQGSGRLDLDVPAWQVHSLWTIDLTAHPDAPSIEMAYSGEPSTAYRDYDSGAMRHYLYIASVERQEEELRRQQQEAIALREELARRAREQAERLAREEAERLALEEAERQAEEEERLSSLRDESGETRGATPDEPVEQPAPEEPLQFEAADDGNSAPPADDGEAVAHPGDAETLAAVPPEEPDLTAPADEGAARGPEPVDNGTQSDTPEAAEGAGGEDGAQATDLASHSEPDEIVVEELPAAPAGDDAEEEPGPAALQPEQDQTETLAEEEETTEPEEPRVNSDQGMFSSDPNDLLR